MKNKYLLLVASALVISISSCKKDETGNSGNGNGGGSNDVAVEQVQRSIFLDFTATWCPPCGKYGKPGFTAALTANPDKLVGLAIHPSSSELVPFFKRPGNDTAFVSPVERDFSPAVVQVSGYPTLFVNKTKLALNTQVAAQAQNVINTASGQSPVAGVGLTATKNGSGVTVKTTVKFFQETSGEYYLSVLMTEDDINRRQMIGDVGGSSNYYDGSAIHHKVLRGAAIHSADKNLPKTFGDAAIASGTVAKDTKVNGQYTFTYTPFVGLPTSINQWPWNPDKTNVVAVIWKKNGNSYEFVNVTEVRIK